MSQSVRAFTIRSNCRFDYILLNTLINVIINQRNTKPDTATVIGYKGKTYYACVFYYYKWIAIG